MGWGQVTRRRSTRPVPLEHAVCVALTALIALASPILLSAGCGDQKATRAWNPPPKEYSSSPSAAAHGSQSSYQGSDESSPFYGKINGMALAFHRTMFSEYRGENLFLSPASLEMALAMAANGAAGETLAAMKRTMGIASMSDEQMNRSNKSFISSLNRLDPSVTLAMANSLWLRNDLQFNEEFIKNNEQSCKAEVKQVDFNAPSTAAEINKWVSDKTQGRIAGVAPPPPGSNFALIDAIYFKGTWLHPFVKDETADQQFNLIGGGEKSVPMMHRFNTGSYYENDQFQMAVLVYGEMNSTENRVSMYVFLPRTVDGLDAFIESLTPENWKTWTSSYCITPVDLRLPRFKFESDKDLKPALASMGMGVAFGESADFSRMVSGAVTAGALRIGVVQQKSYVDVNEEGTEAAAVTKIAEGEGGPPRDNRIHTMVVDHPFFFAIRDDATGAILFTGTVLDPQG